MLIAAKQQRLRLALRHRRRSAHQAKRLRLFAPRRYATDCVRRTRPDRHREMANSSATFSAVSGMECTPYRAFICGLIKRQPMVVSSICMLRLKAPPLSHHKRRAGHASTPPAIISCVSRFNRPRRDADRVKAGTAQAADGAPGTLSGRLASSSAIRATLRLSSRPVGAAKDHIVNARGIQSRVPRQQRFQRQRRQVVSAHRRQGTAETAKGCTHRITDKMPDSS